MPPCFSTILCDSSPFHFIFEVKSVYQFSKYRQLSPSNPALFISLNRPRCNRTSNALRASISAIYRLDFLFMASIINSVKIRPTIDGISPLPFCILFWTDSIRFSFLDRWIFSTTFPTQFVIVIFLYELGSSFGLPQFLNTGQTIPLFSINGICIFWNKKIIIKVKI